MLVSLLRLLPMVGPDLLLPDGFYLPPWPHFVALVVLLVGTGALLWALKPRVTDWTPVAIAPWIVTGGILHALFQSGFLTDPFGVLAPLFNSPAVYATTAIATGVVWIGSTIKAAMGSGSADRPLGVIGTGFAIMIGVLGIYAAFLGEGVKPLESTIVVFVTGLLTALVWLGISLTATEAAAYTRKTGALVIFSHLLDGVSTAVGYHFLNVSERTPLSELVISAGEQLPVIGGGWLFVLVKLALAIGIIVLFQDWVREEGEQARMVLLFVAAVGLGPGMHNVYLFAVAPELVA